MALPVKVRNLLDRFLGNQESEPFEVSEYPDTGETGETYDAEYHGISRAARPS